MAGTGTWPAFTGAANVRKVSLHFIDASGDYYSQVLGGLPIAATDAQVQAIATAFQAASQASLWKISDTFEYVGADLASNAEIGVRANSADGINILYKNGSLSETYRIPAPIPDTMVGGSDQVDVASTELIAVNTAVEAAVTGYVAASAQFTGRRDRSNNPRASF